MSVLVQQVTQSSLNYFEDDECAWLYFHVTFFTFFE